MGELIDLTGKRFGRWAVIEHAGKTVHGENTWLCKCDCGTIKTVSGIDLRKGTSKSCGCLARELSAQRKRTHGMTQTRLFEIWHGMKARCLRETAPNYGNYGARGILVCKEWANDFVCFYEWSMANGYADGLTLDRIDNEKGYFPENCRWADAKTQCNNKRNNHRLTANGETKTVTEWAEKIGTHPETITARLKRGWTVEQAINTPIKKYRRRTNESIKLDQHSGGK